VGPDVGAASSAEGGVRWRRKTRPPLSVRDNVVPLASRRARVYPIAFALVAAVLTVVAARALHVFGPPDVAQPAPSEVAPPRSPPRSPPRAHRDGAEARPDARRSRPPRACDAEQWVDCLRALDDAKKADPVGDSADELQTLGKKANGALGGKGPSDKAPH